MKGMKGIKENNKPFIDQVADFYITTVDEAHPQGNMSAVADQFGITRAKVNKILITAGVIDSPLHRDIMELKEQGYETDDIAAALGVSAATVRINIPYEKVIYNGEEKSAGAVYVEEYRKREKVFLNSVVRKKTDREIQREIYMSDPENQAMMNLMREQLLLWFISPSPSCSRVGESKPRSPGHSCITGEHNNIIQEDGLKVKTNIT